jgi:hypothetical protein
MLIEFSVGNYRSFKDIQTLNLQAAPIVSKNKSIDRDNTFQLNKKLTLLKTKVIYGANASGKSNLILALRDFKKIVTSSLKDKEAASFLWDRNKFRLGEENEEPIFFQLVFTCSGTIYRYGFEVLKEEIVSEWLYGVPKEKEVYFFQREGMSIRINENQFIEGKRVMPAKSDIPLFRANSLFLAVVAAFNGPIANSLMNEIEKIHGIITSNLSKRTSKYLSDSLKKEQLRKKIGTILKSVDGGIEHILNAEFGEWIKSEFNQPPLLAQSTLEALNDSVITIRKRYNSEGQEIGMDFFYLDDEEAEGNKRIAQLSPFLIQALGDGSCLIIDEFDAHLHPNLTRKIVELFHNPESNAKSAQLIVTTHDSNLLDPHLLRRDQICFVEKNNFGVSTLTNLVEYKGVRNDASYEKDYLRGRYGAVPYLGRFVRAFETIAE